MGYFYDKQRHKYVVRVTIDGKRQYIGQYDTEEEARSEDKKNTPSLVSQVPLEYEQHDGSMNRLFEYIRKMRKARSEAKRRDREIEKKLRKL